MTFCHRFYPHSLENSASTHLHRANASRPANRESLHFVESAICSNGGRLLIMAQLFFSSSKSASENSTRIGHQSIDDVTSLGNNKCNVKWRSRLSINRLLIGNGSRAIRIYLFRPFYCLLKDRSADADRSNAGESPVVVGDSYGQFFCRNQWGIGCRC